MNEHKIIHSQPLQYGGRFLAAVLGISLITASPLQAAESVNKNLAVSQAVPDKAIPSYLELSVGQSYPIKLEKTVLAKVSVDNPGVLQVTVTSPREVVLYGKSAGSTALILKEKSGHTSVVDVTVLGGSSIALQGKLQKLLPREKNIRVHSAGDSIVLTGSVNDAVNADQAVTLAEAYSGGKKIINFLQVGAPQQVMLEVKVAEVSKTLTDQLGASFTGTLGKFNSNWSYSLLAGFLQGAPGSITAASANGLKSMTLDAAKTDGLVKILAEPTIMAMSGQEGAFLAGGKIYIPVPQIGVGGSVITLQEEEFGVGLKFTPTVLEDGLINLKVSPEVSEVGKGVTFGTQTLPTITTRRASTTVQLHDGQSFAIGGLIKNNVAESIAAFPGLGDLPVIGALFRSSNFQNDRTELLFVITPHLVKPLPANYALPTDSFVEPSRGEFLLGGKLEGSPKTESPPAKETAPKDPAPATSGFQMQ